MTTRGRYSTVDNWYVVDTLAPERWFSDTLAPTLIIEACDVREANGTIWRGSGRRVVRGRGKIEGFRAKTFIGESAWNHAQHYAEDALRKAERDSLERRHAQ